MKALLFEYGKGLHPQATREVRKTEVDNRFADVEGYFGDQEQVFLQRVTWSLFTLHFSFETQIHPDVFSGATFHTENDPE